MICVPDTPPLIQGTLILLRPPSYADKQDRLAIGRDADYARMVGETFIDTPFTAAEVDEWLHWLQSQTAGWVIDLDGRCIGEARLHHLSRQDRRARYAIGIFDPDVRGQGIGTEVTRLVLDYAFGSMGLHRVDLRVLSYNNRAIAAYDRCGFVVEGIERESAFVDGQWHDDVMMAILEHEYHRQV